MIAIWRKRSLAELRGYPCLHLCTIGEGGQIYRYMVGDEEHYTYSQGQWESPWSFRTQAAAIAMASYWKVRHV